MRSFLLPTAVAVVNFFALVFIFIGSPTIRVTFDSQAEILEESSAKLRSLTEDTIEKGTADFRVLKLNHSILYSTADSIRKSAETGYKLYDRVQVPLWQLGLFNLVAWTVVAFLWPSRKAQA